MEAYQARSSNAGSGRAEAYLSSSSNAGSGRVEAYLAGSSRAASHLSTLVMSLAETHLLSGRNMLLQPQPQPLLLLTVAIVMIASLAAAAWERWVTRGSGSRGGRTTEVWWACMHIVGGAAGVKGGGQLR